VRRDQAGPFHSARWQHVREFTTSRSTDRLIDEQVPGEHEYLLLENRRALPRAWLAMEVLPATDGTMSDAIRASRLDDGRGFDPRTTALVFEGTTSAARYPDAGTAAVVDIADSRIRVNVDSPAGGFLVLSEAYYPGWVARIDGNASQPVVRTDIALQGVTVPAGSHLVTFEFHSRARQIGIALGAAGALALLVTAFLGWSTFRL
jgi:hypothetical protein